MLHGARLPGRALDYPRDIAEPSTTDPGAALTEPGAVRVRRALLSVSDKRGIVEFGRGLAELAIEVVSTGGTATELREAGLEVRSVEDFTGFPEIMDGRVKTLHPRLYAGLLAVRSDPGHVRAAAEHDIEYVDLVCVNLYPFERTAGRRGVSEADVIENIDIGGPTMIRAAAKNHAFTAVVVSPESYDAVLDELRETDGMLSVPTRRWLAAEAFAYTARYDTAISRWFQEGGEGFPALFVRAFEKVTDLRYGENPHQPAAFYRETTHRSGTLADATQLRGERPSFNNLMDLDAAYRIASDYTSPTVAIVKHTDPVGLASADELVEAYRHALETDSVAAFGGIVGVNRELDGPTAREIAANSYEAVVAPGYSQAAIGILKAKAGLEILAVPPDPTEGMRDYGIANLDFKRVAGGLLVESLDELGLDRGRLQVVTNRRPTLDELNDLLFAWRAVRHVRSNAIVLARNGATVGIGAAQASRQVSVEIALRRAGDRAKTAVMASDAYFPFPDGIQMAAQAGVTAIVQPGGSIRDEMAIEVADRHHMAMVFTGKRHFRH
jgi:phosphoribosylaminoimidazolecarboxamide formyltransferase / IMP cyclohydrolase